MVIKIYILLKVNGNGVKICFVYLFLFLNKNLKLVIIRNIIYIWRLPSLSELTHMIFNMGLTHLGSEASIYPMLVYNYIMNIGNYQPFLTVIWKT